MKTSTRTSMLAMTALSLSLLAVPTFANTASVTEMQNILTGELSSVGIAHVDYSKLTFSQMSSLSGIFDAIGNPDDQKAAAEAIINAKARDMTLAKSTGDFPEAKELATIVNQDLASVGIKGVKTGALSLETTQELAGVFSNNGNSSDQKAAAMAILDKTPREAVMMKSVKDFPAAGELENIVVNDLNTIGIKLANPGKLSLEKLEQISAVFNGNHNNDDRAAKVKEVLTN